MTLAAGSRLGPYEIISPLGSGRMGEVYGARDIRLGREVAVKVLPDRLASDPELRARFEREAKALAAVNHPRVCPVYDLGEGQGSLFLVMELLDGVSLQYRMSRGQLPPSEAIAVAQDILDALDALHRRGIIHRDVKPSNVFLTTHGTKLLDLGLALPTDSLGGADPRLTQTGMIVGTPRYMAPEQWEGGSVGPLADVFACGAILFEMLTGKPAFPGEKPMEIFDAVRRGRPPALSGVPGIEAVDRIIRRSLARRPEDRFPSAAAMADALMGTRLDPAASGVREMRALARLIVLPFRSARPDPDLDFLGPALAEAVSAGLTGLSGLVVRSPRLAASLANVDDLPRLAAEADVDAALVGRLLASGDRVRLSAQLVEVPGGTVLAPVTAEASRSNLFELQDELTRQVVEALRLPLTQRERQRIESETPPAPEAYEHYLKGAALAVHTGSMREMGRAAEELRKCVEIDPAYAPAWARLGRIHRILAKYGHEAPDENRRLARQAFERALALSPELPLAHNLYTHFEIEDLGSPVSAMLRLLGRVEAGSADADIFAGLVAACRFAGLLEASVAAHERARALDPHARTSVHFTHWFRGDFERAIAADDEPVDFVRNYSLISLGRTEEALRGFRRWQEKTDLGQEYTLANLMIATIEMDREKCLAACRALLASSFRDPEGLFFMARSAARVGLTDIALDTLENVVRGGFSAPHTFETDAWLDSVRSDPRFVRLLAEAREANRHASELFLRADGPRRLGMSDPGTRRMA